MYKPRVVFDCNVFLQAIFSPNGPSSRCLDLALSKMVRLWVSEYVFRELRRVAGYPEIIAKYSMMPSERAEEVIAELNNNVAAIARHVPARFNYTRDAADAHYVDLAVTANAAWLVTRDKDLHALMTDHSIEGKQFRQLTRNQLRIVSPPDFLKAFESESAE